MSTPQNPFGHQPSTPDPFGGAAFGQIPTPPPILTGGPTPTRLPVNPLATLSVIFAFVFAPAGAVFGHLGLSQVRRTGQSGRERALIGLAASYTVIAITVVAVMVWAALHAGSTHSAATVAAHSHSAGTPVPTPATTTTTSPPPTVAPADLTGLVPTLGDLKSLVGDEKLTTYKESRQLDEDDTGITLDRPQCVAALATGVPDVYNTAAVTGTYGVEVRDFVDRTDPIQSAINVVAFRDIPTAHAQADSIVSAWRRCANSTVLLTYPGGQTVRNDVAAPADTGNGITVLPVSIARDGLTFQRLVAAKSNIAIDMLLTAKTSRGEQPNALAIVNFILDKIPGPR